MKTDSLLQALQGLGAATVDVLGSLFRLAASVSRLVHAVLDCIPPH